MITKEDFGFVLKAFIEKDQDIVQISRWAFLIFANNDYDDEMSDILQYLFSMESDPAFELTYDELQLFAEKLMNNEENVLQQVHSIACMNSFIKSIRELMIAVNFPSSDVEGINVLLENNETENAFSMLCKKIKEQNINVSSSVYERIFLLGQFIKADSSVYLPLKELVTSAADNS